MKLQTTELFETIACPLCGERSYQTAIEGVSAPFTRKKTNIVKCRKCNLQYMNPRPTEECFLEGYASAEEEGLYDAEESDRRVNFDIYLNHIERLLPKKGRILDVGCCRGYFVKLAQERGWDSEGLEPSRRMAEECSADGLKVHHGTILNNDIAQNSYDAITLWDVIEHLRDPVQEFHALNQMLRPGGLIFYWTKNIESLRAKMLGKRYPFIMSQHIVYFSPDTSHLLLERTGFKLQEILDLPMRMSMHRIVNRLKVGWLPMGSRFRNATLPIHFWDNMLVAAQKG